MPTTVTKTIRASGGDYTSLSAWEAAQQGDLVAADEIRVAECYDDWPSGHSGGVQIDGSTTDSTRYLAITVASGHRHNGVPGAGFFLTLNGDWAAGISINDDYCRAEWIDVVTQSGGDTAAFSALRPGVILKNCIGRKTGGWGTGYRGQYGGQLICCAAIGLNTGYFVDDWASLYALNCLAANCTEGFKTRTTGGFVLTNCISYGNSSAQYAGTFSTSSSCNATSTGSDDAPGANSVYGVDSGDFVNAAGNDFHLASGSALIGAGTNLYSTFTTDIDGDTWPSSGAWDIGFDYRVSAAAATSLGFGPRFPRAILNF